MDRRRRQVVIRAAPRRIARALLRITNHTQTVIPAQDRARRADRVAMVTARSRSTSRMPALKAVNAAARRPRRPTGAMATAGRREPTASSVKPTSQARRTILRAFLFSRFRFQEAGQGWRSPMSSYPAALAEWITFFESLPEGERRENLIELAQQASSHTPKAGERFDFEDVRHDAECTDTVGVHVRVENGHARFAMSLGPKVQTLTRAMAVVLCRGLGGSTLAEVIAVPEDFVPRIVGAELVRLRSRTVYYVLHRMKEAARTLLERAS